MAYYKGVEIEGVGRTRLVHHVLAWGEAELFGNQVYVFLVKGGKPYVVVASIDNGRVVVMGVKRNQEPRVYEELRARATRPCKRRPCLLRDALAALARGEEP